MPSSGILLILPCSESLKWPVCVILLSVDFAESTNPVVILGSQLNWSVIVYAWLWNIDRLLAVSCVSLCWAVNLNSIVFHFVSVLVVPCNLDGFLAVFQGNRLWTCNKSAGAEFCLYLFDSRFSLNLLSNYNYLVACLKACKCVNCALGYSVYDYVY